MDNVQSLSKKINEDKYSLIILSVYIFFLGYKIIEMFVGSINIGMNIDEPYHLNQAQAWLNNFFYISENESGPSFTYGPLIGILQLTFNVLLGNGSLNSYANIPLTFELNHILLAAIGFLTSLVFLNLNNVFKKRESFGYLTSVILLSTPIWVGNSFHNMKDIPTAAGYVFVSMGCFLLLKSFIEDKPNLKHIILICLGFIFVFGTRPALILPVLFSFFFSIIYLIFYYKTSILTIIKILTYTVIPSLIAFLILLPQFIQFPLKALQETFYTSSNFPWNGQILMGGRLENPEFTLIYFFKWYFAQTPVIIFVLSLLGLFFYLTQIVRKPKSILFVASSLFFIQFMFTPIYLLLTNSAVYNGLRHILFIYPSIAFFSTLGFYFLIEKFTNKRNIIILFTAIGIIIPNIESIKLMPYQQIYYNPIISILYDVATDWETDYYGISDREAFQHLPKNGNLSKTSDWVWDDPAFLLERGQKTQNAELAESDYWLLSRIYSYIDGNSRERMLKSKAPLEALKPACSAEYVVTRSLRFETIPLAFVSRCQRSGKLLPGFASITWNSQTEISKDQIPYFWLTSRGDSIRVSNITSQNISQNLSFEILPNPCLINNEFEVATNGFSKIFYSPTAKQDSTKVKVPITIAPYKTAVIKLIPSSSQKCNVKGEDKRNFIAGIININIQN